MHPTCAPAIRSLDGGAAPSGGTKNRAFGEEESSVSGERAVRVECEADVAGGLRHVEDVTKKRGK